MTTHSNDPLTPGAAHAPESPQSPPAAAAVSDTLFSIQSEATVLGAMLNPAREKIHHKLSGLLSPDDFYLDQNRAIWLIIQSLGEAGLATDPVAISDAAQARGDFIGGAAYLGQLASDPIAKHLSDDSIEQAASRIKNLSLLRSLQSSLKTAANLCEGGQGFSTVLNVIEDDLINLRRSSNTSRTGPKHISAYNDSIMARLEAKLDNQDVVDGIPTGFPEFDRLIGNLQPETLVVIAARPAMGKTAFAINIEQNISGAGRPTLLFSLEMTGLSIAQRGLARHSRVPLTHIKEAAIADNDWSALLESIERTNNAPCYIDESPGLTLAEIRSRSRAFVAQHPGAVILIDYLQIIAMGQHMKDKQAHISEVSSGLKQLARELKVPVIALAQLSREVEKRANKRPMMSDLRESGQIEQDAEIIVFLYRDEYYNPDTPDKGITEVIIGKNRDGATATVRAVYSGPTMSFSEVEAFSHE